MAWIQVNLLVPQAQMPQCELVLENLAAAAVTIHPQDTSPAAAVLEPMPGSTPLWQVNKVQALFPLTVDVAQLRVGLVEGLAPEILETLQIDFLEDVDWISQWRQHAIEACFGQRLWLLPKDAPAPADPAADAVILRLNPGLAFGSGGHPTTSLCLEWLAQAELVGKNVLDYGCGSGILALAALKLGAATALAVDHDPQALVATQDNAAYNGVVAEALHVIEPKDMPVDSSFDLVIANILANPLIDLAPDLRRYMSANGTLILAGLLHEQESAVVAAYPDLQFTSQSDGDWVRLVGVAA